MRAMFAAACAALMFSCFSTAVAPAQTASTAAYGSNVLHNGDAEAGFGATDATKSVKPEGWQTTGDFTVVEYDAKGEFADHSTPGSTTGGLNYFAGGNAPLSTATQTVSLAAIATDIDAGRVAYDLSAKLGGYGSRDDNAAVTVAFLAANGASLVQVEIGPVKADERLYNTAFVNHDTAGAVPKGARSAVVSIVLTRAGDGYNHAFADNVSLVLTRE